MWGGKGHQVVHLVMTKKHHEYCMQASGKKVANAAYAAWRAKGSKWATKHGVTIEDGKCPKRFTDELHEMKGKLVDFKVYKV